MRKPKRSDDKYWTGTRNFNNIMFISDLEEHIYDLYAEIEQLKLNDVVKSLPDIYEGTLNTARIKQIENTAKCWRVEKSTVRELFCNGADWYKIQAEKQ